MSVHHICAPCLWSWSCRRACGCWEQNLVLRRSIQCSYACTTSPAPGTSLESVASTKKSHQIHCQSLRIRHSCWCFPIIIQAVLHTPNSQPPKTEVREMEQAPNQGGTIRAEVRSLKEETPFCTHRPYCPPLAFSVPLGPYLGYSQSHSKSCSRTPMKSSFKEPVGGWAWWCNSVTPVLKFKARLGYIQYLVLSFNILFLFICACTHAQTYTCHRCRRKSEKGIGCPRIEATGNCEPANMGAGN